MTRPALRRRFLVGALLALFPASMSGSATGSASRTAQSDVLVARPFTLDVTEQCPRGGRYAGYVLRGVSDPDFLVSSICVAGVARTWSFATPPRPIVPAGRYVLRVVSDDASHRFAIVREARLVRGPTRRHGDHRLVAGMVETGGVRGGRWTSPVFSRADTVVVAARSERRAAGEVRHTAICLRASAAPCGPTSPGASRTQLATQPGDAVVDVFVTARGRVNPPIERFEIAVETVASDPLGVTDVVALVLY